MRFNVAGSHTLGIHRKNLLLNLLADARLVFLQQLRFKLAHPVSRHRDLYISEAGTQRFAAVTVSAVVCIFVFVVILAVPKLFIQLGVQPVLHKLGNRFFEEILDVLHAADVAFLQQFPDFCSPGLLLGASILSATHCKNLQCDAPILHHIRGLHKFWDGLMGYFASFFAIFILTISSYL